MHAARRKRVVNEVAVWVANIATSFVRQQVGHMRQQITDATKDNANRMQWGTPECY